MSITPRLPRNKLPEPSNGHSHFGRYKGLGAGALALGSLLETKHLFANLYEQFSTYDTTGDAIRKLLETSETVFIGDIVSLVLAMSALSGSVILTVAWFKDMFGHDHLSKPAGKKLPKTKPRPPVVGQTLRTRAANAIMKIAMWMDGGLL
jgi:hypothetical protein